MFRPDANAQWRWLNRQLARCAPVRPSAPHGGEEPVRGRGIGEDDPALVRGQSQREEDETGGGGQRRCHMAVPPPAAAHRHSGGGQREQQDRGVRPFGQRDPVAERGREQQQHRQGEAVDEAGRRQCQAGQVGETRARGGEGHERTFAGGSWPQIMIHCIIASPVAAAIANSALAAHIACWQRGAVLPRQKGRFFRCPR